MIDLLGLLQFLNTWSSAIQALSSLVIMIFTIVLIWDRYKDRPQLQIERIEYRTSREAIQDKMIEKGVHRFTVRNIGRREAPDVTAERSVRSVGRGAYLDLRQPFRWLPPPAEFPRPGQTAGVYTFKRGGWAVIEVPNDTLAQYKQGILILEFGGGIDRMTAEYFFRRHPFHVGEMKPVRLRRLPLIMPLLHSVWSMVRIVSRLSQGLSSL